MKPLGRARQPSCDCRLLQEHHYKAIGHQRLGSADTQLAFKNDIPGPVRGPTATYLKHLLGKHLCNLRVVLHFASLSCKVGENDEQHCREALVIRDAGVEDTLEFAATVVMAVKEREAVILQQQQQ